MSNRTSRPTIKICGNHSIEDIRIINELKSDIDDIGFIFTPESKRVVSPEQVNEWLETYPDLREKAVGVFLDQSPADITNIIQQTGIKRVQLHGDESPDYCYALKIDMQVKVWKVVHLVSDQVIFNQELTIAPYLEYVDGILLDTKVDGRSGGTGQSFDWTVITPIKHFIELSTREGKGERPIPLMVAGGITSENVAELVKTYPIDGLDVASGVETNLRKDVQKIKALIKGVQKYEQT